jgi:hypothetical protein
MPTEYVVEKFDSGMHFIRVDETTAAALTKNGNNRALCTLNGQVSFHCALMPKKEGGYFVNIGTTHCKKLRIKEGSRVSAVFSEDVSEHQFEMPEELREVLRSDPEADQRFHALSAGNQRSLMYLVAQVKSTDKRIERALKVAEKLKAGITSPRNILKG